MLSIDFLRTKVENYLSSKLTIPNVSKIFKYATVFNFFRLKNICLAFINENYTKVIETSEFEDLHRESMLEIIRFCKNN